MTRGLEKVRSDLVGGFPCRPSLARQIKVYLNIRMRTNPMSSSCLVRKTSFRYLMRTARVLMTFPLRTTRLDATALESKDSSRGSNAGLATMVKFIGDRFRKTTSLLSMAVTRTHAYLIRMTTTAYSVG